MHKANLAACLLKCGPDEMPGVETLEFFLRLKSAIGRKFPDKSASEVRILAARGMMDLLRLGLIDFSDDGSSVVVTQDYIQHAMTEGTNDERESVL